MNKFSLIAALVLIFTASGRLRKTATPTTGSGFF